LHAGAIIDPMVGIKHSVASIPIVLRENSVIIDESAMFETDSEKWIRRLVDRRSPPYARDDRILLRVHRITCYIAVTNERAQTIFEANLPPAGIAGKTDKSSAKVKKIFNLIAFRTRPVFVMPDGYIR